MGSSPRGRRAAPSAVAAAPRHAAPGSRERPRADEGESALYVAACLGDEQEVLALLSAHGGVDGKSGQVRGLPPRPAPRLALVCLSR